jgi:hypothetical protein
VFGPMRAQLHPELATEFGPRHAQLHLELRIGFGSSCIGSSR